MKLASLLMYHVAEWKAVYISHQEDAMKAFLAKYADKIGGIVTGFDRLVFRGYLRSIASETGVLGFLGFRKISVGDFPEFAHAATERLKESSLRAALELDRPVIFLDSPKTNKDELARQIAARDEITKGLVCVLKSTEPCRIFEVYRNRDEKKREIKSRFGRCQHLYHYWIDPIFGWSSARIQTWWPFEIQICLNGREMLARQMDKAGLQYVRDDNCFPWIHKVDRAQDLMDRQSRLPWRDHLPRIAAMLNPVGHDIFGEHRGDYCGEYFWSVFQSEVATDVMFKDPSFLREIYPALIRHGMTSFSCGDVLRFLGRKVHGNFAGDILGDFKDRPEGMRLKYWMNKNSIKIYNKVVLRVETTINHAKEFKVYRKTQGDADGLRKWQAMRQGIADIHRRAEVSKSANGRFLDALAGADTSTTLGTLLAKVCRSVRWKGQNARGLRPYSPEDLKLVETANDAKFCLNGFRNRDLQAALSPKSVATPQEMRQRTARCSRLIRILRAHGLVQKVRGTHRYRVTKAGSQIFTAILTAQRVTLQKLNATAA